MTKEQGSAAEMFEMLATLHLQAPPSPGQRAALDPQVAQALSGLQRMSREQWSAFLRFAELQRVYLRTLQLLKNWSAAGGFAPPFDDLEDLAQAEQGQVEDALASLNKIVRALARLVQKHGVACLVADDPQWAVRVNADGVHIDEEGERLQSALRAIKPGHIVGAGGLPTRDAAMAAGADYVMFGGPCGAEPHAAIVERVAWWAEIFNVPCIGYAHDLGAIGDLVRAGADFIALGDAVFADPRGAAAALRDGARLMAPTPEAAE